LKKYFLKRLAEKPVLEPLENPWQKRL
jgi:hypothetical protein